MSPLRLYVHALRVARPRQLWARVTRPVRRRRFPRATAGPLRAIDEAATLWRSPAFAHPQLDERGAATRLHGFHQHYGEDVLAAARAGDGGALRGFSPPGSRTYPPASGDPWHPYVALDPDRQLGRGADARALAGDAAGRGEPRRASSHTWRANVEDDVLGNHVIRNARALVLGGRALGDAAALERGLALLAPRASGAGSLRTAATTSAARSTTSSSSATCSRCAQPPRPPGSTSRSSGCSGSPPGSSGPTAHRRSSTTGRSTSRRSSTCRSRRPGCPSFEETGYAVFREHGLWLAFDCGPPAPAFLPAHAHADALSFQLWLDGRPVVVDPGTSTYEAGAQRDLERSTAAHATVALDGRSQFELWGAFRSGPLPHVRLLGTDPLAAEVVWPSGARHRRTIAWDEQEIRIDDELDLRGRTRVLSSLPLAADASVEVEPVGELGVETEERSVSERLFDLRRGTALAARGDAEGRFAAGWRIPRPR